MKSGSSVVRGIQGFSVFVFFLASIQIFTFINPTLARAVERSDLIEIRASGSRAHGAARRFFYEKNTGFIYEQIPARDVKRGESGFRQITALGRIANQEEINLEVLAYSPLPSGYADGVDVLVLRHGLWVSVVDARADAPIAVNVGPMKDALHIERYATVAHRHDGSALAIFAGEATLPEDRGSGYFNRFLFFVDSQDNKVGFVKIRRDEVPNANVHLGALIGSTDFTLTGDFLTAYTSDGKTFMSPMTAAAEIRLDEGTIELTAGSSFFSTIRAKSGERVYFEEIPKSFDRLETSFFVNGATIKELQDTGSNANNRARSAAAALATLNIEAANGLGAVVEKSLAYLKGQDVAKQELIVQAKAEPVAKQVSVTVYGGPSRVGKTSAVQAMGRALHPGVEKPVWAMSFSENSHKEFLRTALFGSSPGYVGSEALTSLQSWALKHTDGGILLFDELDKAQPETVEVLLEFFGNSVVKLAPHLVKSMVDGYVKSRTPTEDWDPLIAEKTDNGANPSVEIEIPLIPGKHQIVLTTNAGQEVFTGTGVSNAAGAKLERASEIEIANRQFTAERLKKALADRGYKPEFINRISSFIPFGALLPQHIAEIAREYLKTIEERFAEKYMVKFSFSKEAISYFENEVYTPLEGAGGVATQLEKWVAKNLNAAITAEKPMVKPGDEVVVTVTQGTDTQATLMRVKPNHESGTVLAEYTVGKPLPPSPKALLDRLRPVLKERLDARIIGHSEQNDAIKNQILSQVFKVVEDPKADSVVILINLEGFSGNGKTETAKAIFEAITGTRDGMLSSEMNNVHSVGQLYTDVFSRWRDAAKKNPEYFFWLLDELPRAGEGNPPVKAAIQNSLMSVLDERKIPADPNEYKVINGQQVKVNDVVKLPPVSIIVATGNVMTRVLGPGTERMNNKELSAHFNYMRRHPEQFFKEYEKEYETAFRSRAGDPIMIPPLADSDVVQLRERFLTSSMKTAEKYGVTVELSESAVKFFEKYYVPVRGGRWVRHAIAKYIESPINTAIATSTEGALRGTTFVVEYDDIAHEMRAVLKRNGVEVERRKLADVQITKSEYHDDVVQREAYKTCLHEAGHVIVRATFYGADSIAEVNTFGGGEGGWMEPAVDVPTQNMYLTARKGPQYVAVALGGHQAEEMFIEQGPGNGASSDYNNARNTVQTMLLDGSVHGLKPLPLVKNPSNGQIEFSDTNLREIEKRQEALMGGGGRLAEAALLNNKDLLFEVANALFTNPNMSLNRAELTKLLQGRIWQPQQKEINDLLLDAPTRAQRSICRDLLIEKQSGKPRNSLWKSLKGMFNGYMKSLGGLSLDHK